METPYLPSEGDHTLAGSGQDRPGPTRPGREAWQAARGVRLEHVRTVAITLSATVLLVAAAYVALLVTRAADGAMVSVDPEQWRGTGLGIETATGGSLRAGDRVIAIDGWPLDGWPGTHLAHPPGRNERLAYDVLRDGQPIEVQVESGRHPVWSMVGPQAGTLGFGLALFGIAVFLLFRRPHEPAAAALAVLASGMLASPAAFTLGLPPLQVAEGGAIPWLFLASSQVGYATGWSGVVAFGLTFPAPHRVVAGKPWVLLAVYGCVPLVVAGVLASAMLADDAPARVAAVMSAAGPISIAAMGIALVLVARSWRSAVDAIHRQQLRWVAGGAIMTFILTISIWMAPELLTGEPLLPWSTASVTGIPLVAGLVVALLRFRLFDLDIVVHGTLRYGALLACIAAIYVSAVATVTQFVARATEFQAALVASGVVAVAIGPLHGLLQRAANRIVYGDRDDPYRALASLGRSLESTLEHGGLLASVAAEVSRALRVPFVAIDLDDDGVPTRVAVVGEARASQEFPLVYRGQRVGRLIVAPRSTGEPFGHADLRLLSDFARQIGAAAQAESLMRALQRSRERLVLAREEERSRIRRDLHDGLGPALSAVALQVETARRTLHTDPESAATRLAQTAADARSLVGDIRRLARELRPPVLDELGLVAALRRQRAWSTPRGVALASMAPQETGPHIEIEATGDLDRLPAAVEVAVYRIANEAILNTSRHSGAGRCRVSLTVVPGGVEVEICDDGRGIPDTFEPGVGILSMRERAAELGGSCVIARRPGGGTRVFARIPLEI